MPVLVRCPCPRKVFLGCKYCAYSQSPEVKEMPTLWLHTRLVVASPIWPSQLGSAGCTGPGDSCPWWHVCPLTKSHAGCRGGQWGAGATWGHRSWNKGRMSRNQHESRAVLGCVGANCLVGCRSCGGLQLELGLQSTGSFGLANVQRGKGASVVRSQRS